MSQRINSIRIEITFDDALSHSAATEFVGAMLEHHSTPLGYRWEVTHSAPDTSALAGECAALQHFADVAAGYAEF